jgi:hypothetical protein
MVRTGQAAIDFAEERVGEQMLAARGIRDEIRALREQREQEDG